MNYKKIIILSVIFCFAFFAPEIQAQKKSHKQVAGKTSKTLKVKQKKSPKIISAGVVNGRAIELVIPEYPQAARDFNIYGQVSVQVLINETGDVIKAFARSGNLLLRSSSIKAAFKSKFEPITIGGVAVRVSGIINYNYMPNEWNWLEIGFALENSQSSYYSFQSLKNTLPIGFEVEKQILEQEIKSNENRNEIIETITASVKNKIVEDENSYWLFSVGLSLAKAKGNWKGSRRSSNFQELKSLAENPPKKFENSLSKKLEKFIRLIEQNKIAEVFQILDDLENNFSQLER